MCQNHPQGLLKHRAVGPALAVSEVRSAESDNAALISTTFSGGAHAAGPGMTLGELLFADKLVIIHEVRPYFESNSFITWFFRKVQ